MDKTKLPQPLQVGAVRLLYYFCPEHIDFLYEQGSGRGEQLVFLPDQHAVGGVFRMDRDKPQVWSAVDGQRTVKAESTA